MAKTFLRSGSLDAVLALGENGQPVFLSALQLRETLRLRKQQQIADCLAIPQPNDAGDRLDWYSPVSGKVTSWVAASESARRHALHQLEACQQAVAGMCQRAQLSEKPNQKLFGALLAKAIQFPDRNFVYLVGGKPVITFWGFVSLEKKSRQDALECLRDIPEAGPLLARSASIEPLIPAVAPAAAATPVVAAVAEPAPVVEPVPEPEPVIAAVDPASAESLSPAKPAKAILLRYGWVLPAAALLIMSGIQLKGCVSTPEPAATSRTTAAKPAETSAVETATRAETPAVETATPAETKPAAEEKKPAPATPPAASAPVLPVAPATTAAATTPPVAEKPATETTPAAENTGPASAEPAPDIPVAKDDLVLPAQSVRLGSTKFLNGNWRVIVNIKTPPTGKPPSLRYQFKNGKGVARMTQGDGSVCRVDVYAGLMQSGNLVINSRTKAKCSDGARYQMPELVCRQGTSGPAECSGQYGADTVLPMMMKRESK